MPTIGHHLPRGTPPGEVQAGCGYCGFQYLRSELVRQEGSRLLACPECNTGLDAVTLSKMNARAAARRVAHRRGQAENYVQVDETTEGQHLTSGAGFS